MKRCVAVWIVAIFAVAGATSTGGAENPKPRPTRLLRLDGVSLTSQKGENNSRYLKWLTDGRTKTAMRLRPQGRDIELLFHFAGGVVSPLQIELTFAGKPQDTSVQLAVLVSDEKEGRQFRFVRTELIRLKKLKHRLALPSCSGRRVLLRLGLDKSIRFLDLADLRLTGIKGELASHYLFKESPADALRVLTELQALSTHGLTDEELGLAKDAQDGRLDEWTLAEASLLASGVTDKRSRLRYLNRIAVWERELAKVLAAEPDAFRKGRRLLQWLHQKPMKRGYISKQTRVSKLVDESTFNCVSSAMLYAILGRRLKLDVRGIEVPDHAFGILYDGDRHADVETTNRFGFNPSRDPRAIKAFEGQTGFHYIPERHGDKRREVSAAGLVAMIYYNRGVGHGKERQFHRALNCNFMALSLDRQSASAVKNALNSLGNWTYDLTKAGKFEKAVGVGQVGLKLAPNDKLLRRNHLAAWSQWVTKSIDEGSHVEALALVDRAFKATGSAHFRKLRPWVFIRQCRQLSKSGKWDAAEALATKGAESLGGESLKKMQDFHGLLILARSNEELGKKEFPVAVASLTRFQKLFPRDNRIDNAAGFLAQEWARHNRRSDSFDAGADSMRLVLERFPKAPKVRRAAKSYLVREVARRTEKQQFESARKLVARHRSLLSSPADEKKILLGIVGDESRLHRKAGNWERVIEVYQQALTKLKGDADLKRGLMAAWDGLAQDALNKKQYERAAAVYQQARKQYPRESLFVRNLPFIAQELARQRESEDGPDAAEDCLRELIKNFPQVKTIRKVARRHIGRNIKQLLAQRRSEEALKTLARVGDLIADRADMDGMIRSVYDEIAARHEKKGDYQRSAETYAQAMKRFPKNSGIRKHAKAAWDGWARRHISRKEWTQAVGVYKRALEHFPADGLFTNNLRYCEQESKKGRAQPPAQ